MNWIKAGRRAALTLGAAASLAACSSYPSEPRYPIYAGAAPAVGPAPTPSGAPRPYGEGVLGPTDPATEAPPPRGAPVAEIEGGALDAPAGSGSSRTPAAGPASEGFAAPPPGSSRAIAGASYVIQPGDTISGIGRRFQTPVQVLIDLNRLSPRAEISPGQRLQLPQGAVDIGGDPYATGPSPVGMAAPETAPPPPPPPPPPASTAPRVPPSREPAATAASTATADSSSVSLSWPVRGEIVRRFGPVGLGERNNGINIAAPQGSEVRAAAAGRVGYVGDDLAGQGLTVLIVHRDGWRTVYGHLGSETVQDGQDIAAGQVIGTVGTTAGDGRPSMHFETWRMRGDEPNAVDPLSVLPR